MSPAIAQALVRVLEMKDHATAAHTWRVVLYTRAVAEELGLKHDEVDRLGIAGALHDLGKIDIPTDILAKPAKLTPEEFDIIKRHPLLGEQHIRAMGEEDPFILQLVRSHHEREDGLGYPDGLLGDQIPLAARVFSVIDSFDAMTSYRPYRSDVGIEAGRRAIVELQAGAGTRYHVPSVELFASLFHQRRLDWILAHFNDGATLPGYQQLADVDGVSKGLRRGPSSS
jgi:HD-GYP domain-containing protein (c-di-GMP phosphodiesterase class II)